MSFAVKSILSTASRRLASPSTQLARSSFRITRPALASSFHATSRCNADSPAVTQTVRKLQDLFVEAKDEYETALDSAGTTYAAEDNELARECAGKLKEAYDAVMAEGSEALSQAEKQTVKEKLSARIRELLQGVEHNLHDH